MLNRRNFAGEIWVLAVLWGVGHDLFGTPGGLLLHLLFPLPGPLLGTLWQLKVADDEMTAVSRCKKDD